MIHQHFKLVDVFTAAENIVLGLEGKGAFDLRAAARRVKEISEKYGFDIDPGKKVYDMSVSEKQTVEILKVLYRGADILILDEPTAVLTPQETEKLFAVLRNMRADGKAIVIITHKLHEVMALSDRVAVLRKGKYIGTVHTADTDPQKLTEMMVGRAVSLNIDRPEAKYRDLRLEVKGLTCRDHEGIKTLDDVSFQAFGGEILGIAGIAGSGQKELLEAIAGLQAAEAGSVLYYPPHPNSDIAGYHVPVDRDGEELVGKTPMQIRRVGVSLAFVPEDRLGMGLVAGMDMVDNMMLKTYREHKGPFVDRKAPRALAQRLIDELEIVTPGVGTRMPRICPKSFSSDRTWTPGGIWVSSVFPRSAATCRKSPAMVSVTWEISTSSSFRFSFSISPTRARATRSLIRFVRRFVCLIIFPVHSLFPLTSSSASVFAEMIATGVFSSWLAFVINRFWFSIFLTKGLMALLERKVMMRKKRMMQKRPSATE